MHLKGNEIAACVIIAAGVAGVLGGSLLAERADSVFAPVSAAEVSAEPTAAPVSYTHLTLPTILLV